MLFFYQCSGLDFPPLQVLSQLARPVFPGGGHEDLAAGIAMKPIKERIIRTDGFGFYRIDPHLMAWFALVKVCLSQRLNHSFKEALADAASFLRGTGARETIWRAFVAALVAMVLIYRVELGAAIYSQASQIARLQPAAVPLGKFLKATFNDFTFVCLLGLGYLGLKIWIHRLSPRLAAKTLFKIGEGTLVFVLLLGLALIERTHYQLLLQLDTGLTLDFLTIAPTMVDADDFFRVLTWPDVVFILAPILVFVLACLFARTWRRIDKYVFLLLSALVLGRK